MHLVAYFVGQLGLENHRISDPDGEPPTSKLLM